MLKQLQRRLTIFYTLTTGIILSVVVIAISVISQINLMNKTEEEFQNLIMNISTKLQTDMFFNISWLASMEAENGLIVHIEENGKPLMYQGSWKPPTNRISLIESAKAQAARLGTDVSSRPISSAAISSFFNIKGNRRDQYKCIAIAYPTSYGYKSMVLLYYISPALNTLRTQRLLFLLSGFFGLFALYFASRKIVKNALKPIHESNRKQREFIAAASHELRSPLMVIQSSAQALEAVPEKSRQFTQNINKECKRMGCLISDMLTLASLDAENWPTMLHPLDTNMLLIDFYELYEPICMSKKVPFELNLPDDMLPDIKGDSERISQILSILVDNALAYNIDSRPIRLEASAVKSHICIKVIDHGPGIPDDKKELVFERFYRADNSRKDKQHFGLGLSIAKELAAAHSGTLQVVDTNGGGSTFLLKIPAL